MSANEFFLLLAAVIASASAQFFLKAGALKLGKATVETAMSQVISIATTPELLAGLFCYAIGAVLYILLLTRVKLSVAAPSASIIYVLSVLVGYFVFNEPIVLRQMVGLGLLICGVCLVL